MGSLSQHTKHSTMIALPLLVCLLSVHVLSLPAPDGVVGHSGHGGDVYDERPDPFHFEYGVHDVKYHTDFIEQRSGDESGSMKGEYTVAFLMAGSSMSSTMLMGDMVELSWRSSIVGRLFIQNTIVVDMEVICKILNILKIKTKI